MLVGSLLVCVLTRESMQIVAASQGTAHPSRSRQENHEAGRADQSELAEWPVRRTVHACVFVVGA